METANTEPCCKEVVTETDTPSSETQPEEENLGEVSKSIYDEKKSAWNRDLVEKEKLLTECRNQIQVSYHYGEIFTY